MKRIGWRLRRKYRMARARYALMNAKAESVTKPKRVTPETREAEQRIARMNLIVGGKREKA